MGFWDELECINFYKCDFVCFVMKKKMFVIGLAALVVWGGFLTIGDGLRDGYNKREETRAKYDAARLKFYELCDTDGDGRPDKAVKDQRYTIITGEAPSTGCRKLTLEEINGHLWEEGFGYNGRLGKYIPIPAD